MSDHCEENPTDAIFRAAIPGRLSGFSRRRDTLLWQAPGRAPLEVSVLASAIAILIPICVVVAIPAALVARRAGNGRWLAALLAAIWCGLLGSAVRYLLGVGLIP